MNRRDREKARLREKVQELEQRNARLLAFVQYARGFALALAPTHQSRAEFDQEAKRTLPWEWRH